MMSIRDVGPRPKTKIEKADDTIVDLEQELKTVKAQLAAATDRLARAEAVLRLGENGTTYTDEEYQAAYDAWQATVPKGEKNETPQR